MIRASVFQVLKSLLNTTLLLILSLRSLNITKWKFMKFNCTTFFFKLFHDNLASGFKAD